MFNCLGLVGRGHEWDFLGAGHVLFLDLDFDYMDSLSCVLIICVLFYINIILQYKFFEREKTKE